MSAKLDVYDLAFETPAQAKTRNLRARDAAKKAPPRFAPAKFVCGLCDKSALVLVKMQKFDKSGYVDACGACICQLLGGD